MGPAGPWGEASAKFADLLKERTQGRINVKNYYAGQLFAGKQTNEFILLNQGVADFAFGSTINWSPQVKELNLFFMPFMYPPTRPWTPFRRRGREEALAAHGVEGGHPAGLG